MSDPWYTHAYPGGPMVGPPLIRPLYPPDATSRGKKPSENGNDVVAIKRAVWRGGHWQRPEAGFDGAFSNGFSHGKSGNVSENGLAGVQRQNGLDATGWMGEGTYNLLRSARIPQGLPHAGEPLFDATAIDLLEDHKRSQADGGTLREAALKKAVDQLGYKESPSGSNGNMFGSWYGMNYEPWCAMFCTWCYALSGDTKSFVRGSRYSYCPYVVTDAKNGKYGLSKTTSPIPGDLVVYDWEPSGGIYDHIGLFESWLGPHSFQAIEGNTSTSNNSNGGSVMRRQRETNASYNVFFVRVEEP